MKKNLAGHISTLMLVPALIALAQANAVQAQGYFFSGSVGGPSGFGNGYQEIPFADLDSHGNGGSLYIGTSVTLAFGAISGSLVYNPAASTMQMIGAVSVASSTINGVFSTSFTDTQMINGVAVPASVSLNYTIGNINNGLLSFDTGAVKANNNGHPTSWTLPVRIPVSGTYSFVTGGQTLSGAFNYTLTLNTLFNLQSATSSSMSFSEDTVPDSTSLDISLGQVNASNGGKVNLHAKDPSDGTTYQSWHVDNGQAIVPEPSTYALLGCGMVTIALAIRKRSRGNT